MSEFKNNKKKKKLNDNCLKMFTLRNKKKSKRNDYKYNWTNVNR